MSCSVSQIRMIDINLVFLPFVFQLKKTGSCWESWQAHQWMTEMICLGPMWWLWRWVWTEHQIMFLQYWQIFLCENWTVRLPVRNVCAWWLSGNCVGVRGVFQWLLMWVYKYSLLAPVSWRILFFMVWFCRIEVGFFYLNDTNVFNVSFKNLQFSFSFSCCTHDLNDIICWWTNNHGDKKKICDWSWAFSWTISCCFKFENENCFSSTFDVVYISCHLF